jgi:sugar lactone lactonase YvrE
MEVEHLLAVSNELGEGPLWVAQESALYWLDINKQRVYRFFPSTGNYETFEASSAITSLGARASGGFVVATANGFAFWHPPSQELDFIAKPEAGRPSIRFNDGAVDHHGRFWAGTVNVANPRAPDGSLYRLDPDKSIHKMGTGFTCSNGIGWSPDDRIMYFTDTYRRVIWAYDYDPVTGSISHQRPFVEVPEGEGVPDGLAIDSEGCIWSAHWDGWKITRYDPAGRVEREVRLPVQRVTSCAFGGDNLDELYITTAWEHLGKDERKRQPLAGDLFRMKLEVQGIAEARFTG